MRLFILMEGSGIVVVRYRKYFNGFAYVHFIISILMSRCFLQFHSSMINPLGQYGALGV